MPELQEKRDRATDTGVPHLGNSEGLGEVRKKELVQSGLALGLRDKSDVFVVDNP